MKPLAIAASLALALLGQDLHGQCEQTKLLGGAGGINEQFGNHVAISGLDGIVGRHFYDGVGADSGSATILRRQPDGTWAIRQHLFASDEAVQDRFGFKVDIDTSVSPVAVVGARYNADAGYGSGSVYVFEFTGAEWEETAYLTASDESAFTLFGTTVAVSGEIVAVGATGDDTFGLKSGAGYVFEKVGGNWIETAKLTGSDPGTEHRFGNAVAADASVGRVVFSSPGYDGPVPQSGAVHLYEKVGGVWTEQELLEPSDAQFNGEFGLELDVEGDVIAVGAQLTDGVGGSDSGKVYIFEKSGGTWNETAILEPHDSDASYFFGCQVSLSEGRLLVGSWPHSGGEGSAYIYTKKNGVWTEDGRLQASDPAAGAHFGHALDISGDNALIGARRAKDAGNENVGAVYGLSNVGAFRTLGASCPGTGGISPRLFMQGCPTPGGDMALAMRDGLGGALTALYVGLTDGNVPLATGCSVNIDPFLFLFGPFNLTGAGAGDGAFDLPLVPPAGTQGLTLAMQAVSADPGVPGLVFTNGVEFTINDP